MAVLGVILTQELHSENQSTGPGPLSRAESLCILPRRPSSSLECGSLRIGPPPQSPHLPQPGTAARGVSPPQNGSETCPAALAGLGNLAE